MTEGVRGCFFFFKSTVTNAVNGKMTECRKQTRLRYSNTSSFQLGLHRL